MLPCAQIHFALLGSVDSMDLIVPQRGNQSQNGGGDSKTMTTSIRHDEACSLFISTDPTWQHTQTYLLMQPKIVF